MWVIVLCSPSNLKDKEFLKQWTECVFKFITCVGRSGKVIQTRDDIGLYIKKALDCGMWGVHTGDKQSGDDSERMWI